MAETATERTEMTERLGALATRAAALWQRFAAAPPVEEELRIPDPDDIARTFARATAAVLADPERLLREQTAWFADLAALQRHLLARASDEAVEAPLPPEAADRRFRDEAWQEPPFDFLLRAYAVTVRRMRALYDGLHDLDRSTRRKLDFYLRLYLHAIAPSNFAQTNPVVLRRAVETRGESLLRGLEKLLADIERGHGRLRIRTTRREAFELGRDLATTPGKVVFRNELFELIQYAPSTEQVRRVPLLIVPPWINKYYILDMRPRNSFVRFAVAQGLTVFLISWVNPDEKLRHVSFEDYLARGVLAALDAVRRQTGEERANIVGYCIGGTLTACLLAWLAARGDDRIRAATLFTALTDFSEPGDLGVFIDEEQLARIERYMERRGYLDASYMQTVFSLLRDNDLIWSFVIDNYLLGRDPMPFDLLYWNDDSTHMPAMMHRFYLRKFYLENRLVEPGGITLLGEPLDLGRIRTPCYFLATREDHIAPWKSVYSGARRFGAPLRFVLAGSGHIAGVINPAGSTKYGYWTNRRRPADPERFFATATRHEGSWWPDWAAWIGRHSGGRLPARNPAGGPLAPLADAPGDYVRVRRID